MILCLLLFAYTNAVWWHPAWMPPINDDTCKFNRNDGLACLTKFVDVSPKDGAISRAEVDLALKTYSSYLVRKTVRWIGGIDRIMKDCDHDKNGLITAKDWVESKNTCMPFKKNMCQLEWFCKRAEGMKRDKEMYCKKE
jgi:hypothetical protein